MKRRILLSELQKLYRSLESGSITEEEFEARESELFWIGSIVLKELILRLR